MSEVIASGEIDISLHDAEAIAALRKLEREFKKAMNDIDRQKATVDIDANLKELKKDLKEAEAAVKAYQKRIDDAEKQQTKAALRGQQKRKEAAVAAAKASIAALNEQTEANKRSNKESDLARRRLDEIAKLEERRERVLQANARRQAARARAEEQQQARAVAAATRQAATAAREERQRIRDIDAFERRAEAASRKEEQRRTRELNAAERAQAQLEKERAEVPKLEYAYLKLQKRLEALSRERLKARGDKQKTILLNAEEGDINAQIERIRDEIQRRVGRDPIDLPIRLSQRAGERVRFNREMSGSLRGAAAATAIDMERTIRRGIVRGLDVARDPRALSRTLGRGLLGALAMPVKSLGRGIAGLADMTIRLGPFTTTLQGLARALTVLGPILVTVAGALGALVAVAGSAAVGFGALSLSVLGGLIPGIITFGTVLKPVIADLKNITTVSKAYKKALAGGNEKLAAKKLAELDSMLGNVDASTRKTFMSAGTLRDRWKSLTEPAKANAFKLIASGLDFANKNMKMFAKNTNEFSGVLAKGTKGILSGMDTGQLDRMMHNFNKFLGPMLDGVGNLLNYFIRVGAEASKFLSGFSKGGKEVKGLGNVFKDWTQGLLDTTKRADFSTKIDKTVESLKSLGRFLMSAGRLMKAFFSGGVSAGQDFLSSMTKTMDRWAASMRSAQGRVRLDRFFRQAVEGTKALWNALAPLIATFVRWATLLAPIGQMFFEIAGAVTKFIAELLRVTGLAGPLQAIAATLILLWSVKKISAAARAVALFTAGLLGLSRAQAGVAATGAAAAASTTRAAAATVAATTATTAAVARQAVVLRASSASTVAAAGAAAVAARAAVAGRTRVTGLPPGAPPIPPAAAANATRLSRALGGIRRVGGGAITALTGLSAGTGALVIGAAAAAYGIYKLVTRTKSFEKAAENAKKHGANWRAAIAALPGLHNQVAQAAMADADQANNLAEARRTVNDLTRQGKTDTEAYRDAQRALRAELLNDFNITSQLSAARREEKKTIEQAAGAALLRSWQAKKAFKDKLQYWGMEKQYNAFSKAGFKNLSADMQKLFPELQQLEIAQARYQRQQQLSILNNLNQARALKQLAPIGRGAAKALTALSKVQGTGGRSLASNIASKFVDRGEAARVAQTANKTLSSGVKGSVITKIIADSSSAEQAIRRLGNIRIPEKKVKISESGGGDVGRVLSGIAGKKLNPKRLTIAERGGAAVQSKIGQISAARIGAKIVRFIADDKVGAVLGKYIGTRIIGRRQVVVETLDKTKRGGADGGAFASGGTVPNALQQARAGEMAPVRKTRGGKYTSPTMLVGEENSTEIVIATNPAYRQRNKKYLAMAGQALGMEVTDPTGDIRMAAGGSPGKFNKKGEFNPATKIDRKKVFKPSKKRKAKLSSQRGWANYIDSLQDQRQNWEREVSIRESQVQEPRDTIIETGTKDVVDPATGEVTKVPQYAANPEIENTYKPALEEVMKAMRELSRIVVELVRAIPEALKANLQERQYHTSAIGYLSGRIKGENKKSKPKKDLISKWQERRDEHEQVRGTLKEDETKLLEDRTDAGFAVRELDIAYGKTKVEHDEASPEADKAAEKESLSGMPSSGGSGGGGASDGSSSGGSGGEGGLSIQAQTALTLQQNAETLAAFGSNFIGNLATAQFAPGAVGAPGTGANQGAQLNPASRSSAANNLIMGGGSAGAAGAAQAMAAPAASNGVTGTNNLQPAGDKNVTVVNNFAAPPADSHTWSKGIEFELGAII